MRDTKSGEESIDIHTTELFLPNGNITSFHKTHEVFVARQPRDNLDRDTLYEKSVASLRPTEAERELRHLRQNMSVISQLTYVLE